MSAVLQKRQNIYVWIAARQVPHPQGNVFRLHSLGSRSCSVLKRSCVDVRRPAPAIMAVYRPGMAGSARPAA